MELSMPGRSLGSLLRSATSLARRRIWSTDVYLICAIDLDASCEGTSRMTVDMFRRDAVEDFRHYRGTIRHLSTERLMVEARNRLAAGEHCYTLVTDEGLVHWAWLQVAPSTIHVTEVDMRISIPPRSGVGYDAYTEPVARGRGLHKASLRARMRDAHALGLRRLICGVLATNAASRRSIGVAGLRPMRRLVRRRIMGLSFRREESVASELRDH
jgi:GNAT superfamily N-acetyltransferase